MPQPNAGCSHNWQNASGGYQKCSKCGGTIPTDAE